MTATYPLHRRVHEASARSEMPLWQERLFMALAAGTTSTSNFCRPPSKRVIEIGRPITLGKA